MSEFRKQRLVAKLFDAFSINRSPYEFLHYLEDDGQNKTFVATEAQIHDLASTSSDPERFCALAQFLASKNPNELGSVLHILHSIRGLGEKANAEIPSAFMNPQLANNVLPPPIENDFPANDSILEADEELDEISRKLNKIHNKIGSVSGGSARAAELLGSGNIQVRLFKQSFEHALISRPVEIRELCLVEDLLFVLLGHPGSFFAVQDNGFAVDESIDGSLLPLVSPILELSANMQTLHQFAKSTRAHSSGRVLQAFGTAIDAICLEYQQLVVALEKRFNSGGFLLAQLTFYLRPFFETARTLFDISATISSKKYQGGALLNFLEVQMAANAGNAAYHSVLERVLIPSASVFLDCLHTWLNEGRLANDMQDEFMIGFNAMSDSELEAYEIKTDRLPCLFSGIAQKILLIGTYQGILCKCCPNTPRASVERASLVYCQTSINRTINGLFNSVNQDMVGLLEGENRISSLLTRLKHLFFVDQLDSLLSFLDSSKAELAKNAKDVDLDWVKRKLEESCTIGETDEDSFGCHMASQSIFEQLQGIIGSAGRQSELPKNGPLKGSDTLVLELDVSFPMNLVISRDSLSKYQIIFRFLLTIIGLDSRLSAKQRLGKFSPAMQKLLAVVRHSMSQFVLNLHSFMAYQVLQPQFNSLMKNMKNVPGLDKIIALHTNYLDTCLRECLLTNSKLIQLMSNIFATIDRFCSILETLQSGIPAANLPSETEIATQIVQLQQHFSKYHRVFLEALQYYSARDSDHYLGNLLTQLDFNSFYYASAFARQGNDQHATAGMVTE